MKNEKEKVESVGQVPEPEFHKVKRDTMIHQETFLCMKDVSEYLSTLDVQPLKVDIQFGGPNRGFIVEAIFPVD